MKVKHIFIQFFIFALLLLVFIFGFQNTQKQISEKDFIRVKEAIQKAALECYSIEGKYPQDITYLKDYYGLILQEDMYSIRYEYIAENIMPAMDIYHKQTH